MTLAERLMLVAMFTMAAAPYVKAALPSVLPLLRAARRNAGAIDKSWFVAAKWFAAGMVLAFVLGGKLPEIPWPVFPPKPPTPDVVVVPGSGPMVLMVQETDALKSYTADQLNALDSTAPGSVRDYCANHCAKIDGLPAIRVIDKDQIGKLDMDQPWVAAAASQVDTAKLPYVVMSNGKTGAKMPIENPSMLLAAIQRLEGGK